MSDTVSAWFYFRGRLTPVADTHPDAAGNVARGAARVRLHAGGEAVLAVQARSWRIVRQAVAACLADPACGLPDRISAEWPGNYREFSMSDWRY